MQNFNNYNMQYIQVVNEPERNICHFKIQKGENAKYATFEIIEKDNTSIDKW